MSNIIQFPIEERKLDIAYNRVSDLFFNEFGESEEYDLMMDSIEQIMEKEKFNKEESIEFLNTIKIEDNSIMLTPLNDNEVSNVR